MKLRDTAYFKVDLYFSVPYPFSWKHFKPVQRSGKKKDASYKAYF